MLALKDITTAVSKNICISSKAYETYRDTLSSSRECIALNKESFYLDDDIISHFVKKGQHLYHISKTNSLNSSKSTIYRHFHKGYYSINLLDLPRAVKFKPRKEKKEKFVPKKLKEGRTYEDFSIFIEDNNINHWVEMDTVIGEVGGKVLLTLDFTFCNFIVGILLEDKTSSSVANAIISLKKKLSDKGYIFGDIFPIILTDNGGEFSNVFAIENNLQNKPETKLFYCDPYKSCQKPHVENTHTQLRNILKKGTSFNKLKQSDIDIIFSHINSVKKKSLQGKSAYEMFTFMYGEEIAKILNIEPIPAHEVIQNELILKKLK